MKTVPEASALAKRIAREIVTCTQHDGELDERWIADWIDQEAIQDLREALEATVNYLKQNGFVADKLWLKKHSNVEEAIRKAKGNPNAH